MRKQTKNTENRPSMWSVFIDWITSSNFYYRNFRAQPLHIRWSDEGFGVYEVDQLRWELKWDEIVGVVAFKRDLYSIDQICFGFQTIDRDDLLWCITEDMQGYKNSFEHELEKLTGGAWPDRFKDVAYPAFELCWTEIWKAKNAPTLDDDPDCIWRYPPE